MQRIREIITFNDQLPASSRMKLRLYLSMVFGCPYEGNIPFEKSFALIEKLTDWGISDFEIGDTIGIATPKQVSEFLYALKDRFNIDQFGMHFHNTRGMAIANVLASYQEGIRTFSSSAGGIGGCPYASGSAGNVATEEVVFLLSGQGYTSLPDPRNVANAAIKLNSFLKKPLISNLALYYQKNPH
jgi:hydroxymethylglutaryl-CoA lyase